jgi:hypothetical protein
MLVILTASTGLAAEPASGVRCVETDDAILVTVDGKNVLKYNKATLESPDGIDPVYRRSGHIHPIYTPDGKELTGDFPADHPHQHALFSAWRIVEFEGRQISFWDQLSQTGRVSHSKVISTRNGRDAGQFVVELLLEDITDPDRPKPVLIETHTVDIDNRGNDQFVFDVTIAQKCAGASPVTVTKYHYGGLAIRGNDQWFSNDAQAAYKEFEQQVKADPEAPRPPLEVMKHDFLTSEGKHQYAGNHSRPRWVDLYGPIDGEPAGIAIMCHPDNFRAPQPVRLHPSKPYFCFSPMVEAAFDITPEKPFTSRYRFVVHRGKPDPESIEAEWKRFAESE